MPQQPENKAHSDTSEPTAASLDQDQRPRVGGLQDAIETPSIVDSPTSPQQRPDHGLPPWAMPVPTRSKETTRNIVISAVALAVAITVAVGGLAMYSIARSVGTVNSARQLSQEIATAEYPRELDEPDDQSDQNNIAEQSRKRLAPQLPPVFPQTSAPSPAPTEVGSGPGQCSTTALGTEGGRVSIEAGTIACPNAAAVIRKAYNDLGPGGGLLEIKGVASWLCTGVTTDFKLRQYKCETPMGDQKITWTTNR